MILFQGLAQLELGKNEKANEKFSLLLNHGQKHLDDTLHIDFFAVSLPGINFFFLCVIFS